MRWAIAFAIFVSSEVLAQVTCEYAQNRFFGEACSSLSRIVWNTPDREEVKLTLLSSERDRLSCGHLRGLRRQTNSFFSVVDGSRGDNAPTSTAQLIRRAELRIAETRTFRDYILSRFFRKSQFLEISFEHPMNGTTRDERVVVFFNGGMSEYSAAALRSGIRDERLALGLLTNSAELCFRNNVLIVVYQDILHKSSFLLYRQPLVSRALAISYDRLEDLEKREALYRNRSTDNAE